MIVVFDLDDTLYPEHCFVRSGFRTVSTYVAENWGVSAAHAERILWASLDRDGRGRQLDVLCETFAKPKSIWVPRLLRVYRHHRPSLQLPRESRRVLAQLSDRRLYLVTDGHKVVQANKISALGLWDQFQHCYLTNRYGICNQKPSPYVFELITRSERCHPQDVVHVADDPAKDFRGIRPLGFRTIRVRTGRHARTEVPPQEDAELSVPSLAEVPAVIATWEQE